MEILGNGLNCKIEFGPPDNEGWMKTSVEIEAPHFQGSFNCTVEKVDWKQFVSVLKNLNNSIGKEAKLEWCNLEENIEFKFELSKLGKLYVSYRFSSENFSLGPVLSGNFEADQSYIAGWLNQAKNAA